MAVVKLFETRTQASIQRYFAVDDLADAVSNQSQLRPGDRVVTADQRLFEIFDVGRTSGFIPMGEFATKNEVSAVISAPAGTEQVVTLTFTNPFGTVGRFVSRIWLTLDDPAAFAVADPPTAGVVVSGGVVLDEVTTDAQWVVLSASNGTVVLTLDNAGGSAVYEAYVVVEHSNGQINFFGPLAVPEA